MDHRWSKSTYVLFGFGLIAFLLAGLSVADMFLPRPYDGVVLEADAPGRLIVREVIDGSGADRAGIRHDHQIVGIDRSVLRSTAHAAELLNRYRIGETVPYLVRGPAGLEEVSVQLGQRQIGSLPYLVACILGFTFFFTGVFVLRHQPRQRAAQIFFIVCILFLLFLVCRLRPASYSWVDTFVLTTGMLALLFLPACFLHFFLIFPKPVPLRPEKDARSFHTKRKRWLLVLAAIYLMPVLVLVGGVLRAQWHKRELLLISGAPAANWWVLAVYMLLGLTALAFNARRLDEPKLRRGAFLVLLGSLFGLLPFLITAVAFPSFLHTEKFLYEGVVPLILVPLTFAYAIVRFQLLDIRVILRKGLLYTGTTVILSGLYALGIVLFGMFFGRRAIADSPYFPFLFVLVIVLLFEPLRRWEQVVVDRFFFAQRSRLQRAMRDMGQAFAVQVDLAAVVRDLVEQLPQTLGLDFAALYLIKGDTLERVAGPTNLPAQLPLLPVLQSDLVQNKGLVRLDRLSLVARDSPVLGNLIETLQQAGVEVVGDLASPRRRIGLVLLSGKVGHLSLDQADLDLLDTLLSQAAMALETSMLLEERTEQAELQRELQIAASVQARLLPQALSFGPGWKVEAVCQPARHVGGDFFTELPGPHQDSCAVVYGDVAGKSVSGALVMMAAHEALHSLAMTHRDPETLFSLANQRLYGLAQKSFVALAYMTSDANGDGLQYMLAGQPQPLLRCRSGEVRELPLPEHRLPLGALSQSTYELSHVRMGPGDVVLGYSDGVIDALSPRGEAFGSDRLVSVVTGATESPRDVVAQVVAALEEFTQGTEPYDDVTLVAVGCDLEV